MRLGPFSPPAPLTDPVVTSYDLERFCAHVTSLLGREVTGTSVDRGEIVLRVNGSWWYADAVAALLGDVCAVGLRIEAGPMTKSGGPYR